MATATSTPTAFLDSLSSVSTVPANGDVNPYGLVMLSTSVGKLRAGEPSLFSTISASSLPGSCPGGVGLTTALSVLPDQHDRGLQDRRAVVTRAAAQAGSTVTSPTA